MLKAPANDLPPPTLPRIAITVDNSSRAPPIPTKPRAISSHDIVANSDSASARILQVSAKTMNVRSVLIDISPFNDFSTNFKTPTSSNKPAPSPNNPLAISPKLSSEISTKALANILIAMDIAIIAIPAFITPFESNFFNDFVSDLKLNDNIVNIAPIAKIPFATSLPSSLAIDESEADSIPIAMAIATRDEILIPEVKDSKAPCTWSKIPLNLSPIPSPLSFLLKMLSMVSLILSSKPLNFFNAINIPPPAKPAKISPIETCSDIHVKVFTNASLILPATFEITAHAFNNQSPTLENTSPKLRTPSVADTKISEILPNPLDSKSEIVEKNFPVAVPLLRAVKKSPIAAAISRIKSAKLLIPLD